MDNARTAGRVACGMALLFSTALGSCRKEADRAMWDVDLLVPLIRTTFTIGGLVADSLIQADAQGQLTLVYSSDLFNIGLDLSLIHISEPTRPY